MVQCVSWAADSEAFIFHQSCAAIRGGFQPGEGAAATVLGGLLLPTGSYRFNKSNANERGHPRIGLNLSGNFFDHQAWLSDTHLGDCQ